MRSETPDNESAWSMMETSTIYGKLAIIFAWYWIETGFDEDFEDFQYAVTLIPPFIRGETEDFTGNDWWYFYDSVGSFPERDALLDEMYEVAKSGYEGNPVSPPPVYCPYMLEDEEDEN